MADIGRKHLYRHDCDLCRFLGQFVFEANFELNGPSKVAVDLYACGEGDDEALVARFSSVIKDYVACHNNFAKDVVTPGVSPSLIALREAYTKNLQTKINKTMILLEQKEEEPVQEEAPFHDRGDYWD